MYGYKKRHEELLTESGMARLKDRRENAIRKFATKTQKNPAYSHWFRLNPNQTSEWRATASICTWKIMREHKDYTTALSSYMRRVLNKSEHTKEQDPHYLDLAYLFDLSLIHI